MIAIGGGFGSLTRIVIAKEIGHWLGNFLPYGTLVVNVLGSLALGWLRYFWIVQKSITLSDFD